MKTRAPGGPSLPPAASPSSSTQAKAPPAPSGAAPTAPTASVPTSATFDASSGASRSNELDGTSRGYTSPTQVASPFSPEERVQLAKKIPCPALAGMFNSGMLRVEKDGTVKIPDLERALSQLGPGAALRKLLTNGADKTDAISGQFNLFKLNGSNLDHTGSSGVRQNGVHPERFEKLMSFSKDGERLTRRDLADAAEAFAKEDPGLRGRVTQQAEMALVLEVFGRTASDGSRFFTRADAKQLFVDGQIPSSWNPPVVPGKVGIGDVLGSAALGLFRQLTNGR